MKKMIFAAILAVGSMSLADGAGTGAEEVIAAGGLTTVVGGCADAQSTQNGENSELTYTGPCQAAATAPLTSNYTMIFPTYAAAEAGCRPGQGSVQAVYNWKFQLQGFSCVQYNDGSTGN
jgi:hypothetical protein